MSINIGTLALFQSTLNDMNKNLSSLAELQTQISSGQKAQDFEGLGAQSIQFLNLQAQISKTDLYADNNATVIAQLDNTNTALTQIVSIATTIGNLIATTRTGTNGNVDFGAQLNAQWQQLTALLNTVSNGQYIFSGTSTNVKPVDDSLFPINIEKGVPDASYYRGSNQDITVRPQDNVSFAYSVRANQPAFQKLFTALALAKSGADGHSDADLSQAYDMVQDALQGIITLQSNVNNNKVNINTINTNLQSFKLYWKGLKDSIGNTDLVAASTQVAVDQGVLQAAFQAFSRLSSLHLTNFLSNG